MSSAKLILGRSILAKRIYKMSLKSVWGVSGGNIDVFAEYNRYMIIKALEWNEDSDYYTSDAVQCLEGKISRPSRNCNC